MLKRTLMAVALIGGASQAMADAAGGAGCGWGQMLFEGKNGTPVHVLAITTNGTSGNNTFGVSSGTNGCSSNGKLGYSGKAWMGASASIMNEFSEDVARGDGDALKAVAVSMGVQQQDRAVFAQVLHDNFSKIFTSANVTSDQVYDNMVAVMKADNRLSKYVS